MFWYSVFYGQNEKGKTKKRKKNGKNFDIPPLGLKVWSPDFWTRLSRSRLVFWGRLDQYSWRFSKNLDFILIFWTENLFHIDLIDLWCIYVQSSFEQKVVLLPQYFCWKFGSKTSTVCFCSWNCIGLNLGSRICKSIK